MVVVFAGQHLHTPGLKFSHLLHCRENVEESDMAESEANVVQKRHCSYVQINIYKSIVKLMKHCNVRERRF